MLIISESDAKNNSREAWYFEKLNDSDCLLITAGDSWTWGDSLGGTTVEQDQFEYRTTHSYGYLIADQLNVDYLCISKPGASNVEVYDKIQQALDIAKHKYKQITVVFTLTEIGREMINDPIWVSTDMQDVDSLNEFLNIYECNMFKSFQQYLVKKYPSVKFLFARNFTYTEQKNLHLVTHTEHTWIDILKQHVDDDTYPNDLRFLTQMSTIPIIQTLKNFRLHNKFKLELMEQLYNMELAITWLDFSDLNSNWATRHPLEKGHNLWANYLLSILND